MAPVPVSDSEDELEVNDSKKIRSDDGEKLVIYLTIFKCIKNLDARIFSIKGSCI